MSIPFYDFPSSPILIIGALGIAVAIAVFFVAYQKYFNSPLNKELTKKKKSLIREKKELSERLEQIEIDLKNLKNLWIKQFQSKLPKNFIKNDLKIWNSKP